jgi:MerR family transcriptional regulator, light-induced transcriptional regulator
MNDLKADEFLPIREISRLTGINTVTLRAWERRYGLLKPQRTEKGHRLYTPEDLQRIQQVQYWLNKGLAISKVNELVQRTYQERNNQADTPEIDSIWDELQNDLYLSALEMNRRKLDKELERLFSEYPVELLADNLILPLLNQLRTDQFPRASVETFFTSIFEEQLCRMQYRQRQTAKGKTILVMMASPAEEKAMGLLLNYGLLINSFKSEVISYIDNHELAYAMNKLEPDYLCLLGYHQIDENLLLPQINKLLESKTQLILLGAVAEYMQSSVPQDIKDRILLVSRFQDLLQKLTQDLEEPNHAE